MPAFAKEPAQTRESNAAKFLGAASCSSSSCHGGAGDKRDQYLTWSQKDFHTKAFAILLDARSARIAEAVGITEPQTSARCTVCHSPFQSVATARLATTEHPDEGVSCESCHNAAERWLRGHTRKDWSYAMRVSAGMRDLRSIYVRANTCVACHQNIDTTLLTAGHPLLWFELDSQSINEPKHWRDDDPQIDARSWLVGQAVALREVSWALAKTNSTEQSQLLDEQDAFVWLLGKTSFGGDLTQASSLGGLQNRADQIAKRATEWNPTQNELTSLLQMFAESDSEVGKSEFFFRARRLVLALDVLTRAVNANGGALKIDRELQILRDDVRYQQTFDAPTFAKHLGAIRAKL